jgi:predicted unusual protein kinase regulating ubiquinone biosynthesis (AarF/ABC1/UbiB family)
VSGLPGLVSLAARGALRLGQTGRVLAGTGIDWLRGQRPPPPRLMRQTFERLGATYIKLGQLIASSPSIFPAEYVTEFQHCLDQTTPLPWSRIRKTLKQELGSRLETEFLWVDPEPLASASIAQVHAARLAGGEDVVLKVRKPGVQRVIVTDLNLLHLVARITEKVTPGAAHASLAAIVEEIQGSMMQECDFLKEAGNIEAFRSYLHETGNTTAVAPWVRHELTTSRVLVMERLWGVPLTDPAALAECTDDPEGLLVGALDTWFGSLMNCRTFHADLHAGNLLALRDGRVGFIDFGIVGTIREETWRALFALADGLPRGDFGVVAEALAGMGATKDGVDVARLAADLEDLFERLELTPARPGPEPWMAPTAPEEDDLNRALMDLVAVGRRHGIRFPREFTLLVKQFLYFDRYIRMLAPDLSLLGDARFASLPRAV